VKTSWGELIGAKDWYEKYIPWLEMNLLEDEETIEFLLKSKGQKQP